MDTLIDYKESIIGVDISINNISLGRRLDVDYLQCKVE